MTDPDELTPLARRLLEKHLAVLASGPGGRGVRQTVPDYSPDEHRAAYAELVRGGYLRLGTMSFSGDEMLQNYELTPRARQLLG